MDNPEVLVHISTPATRANDDLYQSLASAYLEFESHQQHQTQLDVVDSEELPELASERPQHHSSGDEQRSGPDNEAPKFPSMDSYGSFPSHMTSGDLSSDPYGSQKHKIVSSMEDLSISRLERLERIQTRWKQQRTPRSSLDDRRKSNSIFLPANESSFIEDTQEAFQALESQLMDDLSTTSEDPEESADDDGVLDEETGTQNTRSPFLPSSGNIQAQTHDTTHLPDTLVNVPSSNNAANSPRLHTTRSAGTTRMTPTDRQWLKPSQALDVVAVEKTRVLSSQRSIISAVNSREASQVSHRDDPSHNLSFDLLSTVVSPPPSEITIEAPDTLPSQVTPHLEELKQQNMGRFKPKTTMRILEADERGHWKVDCRLWPKYVQYDFWLALQKDVGEGRLGWGVTLHRDAVRMRLGLVRLYCWGEIAEHMWLILWLHSGGRVWSTGAAWVDADDVEVITT